jgi:hypothetical protein
MLGINANLWRHKYATAGFHMTFKNGWTVSVQFGEGSCSENRNKTKSECINAEIAAWDASDEWYSFDYDNIKGWCDADEVADFITMIKAKEN